MEVKSIACPFEGCSTAERISSLRTHINNAHVRAGFVVADSWLDANDSRVCSSCKILITSNSNRCSDCRSRPIDAVKPSKARYLPALHLNHVVQLSLGTTTEALELGLPEPSRAASIGVVTPPLKVCCLNAGGSCNCGDTGCEGPVPVRYDVSCSSTDFISDSRSMSVVGTTTDCSLSGGGASVCLSTPTDGLTLLPFDREMKDRASGEEDNKHTDDHHTHERPVRSSTVVSVACPVRSVEVETKVRSSETERKRDSESGRGRSTTKSKKLRAHQIPESKGCVPPPQSLLAARVPGIREVRSRRHKELLAPRVALDQCEEKAHTFFVPLMDLCRVDTPLVKRVPNSQCSRFATMWGKLLSQAVADKSLGSWSEFFMFPKCLVDACSRRQTNRQEGQLHRLGPYQA